MKDKGDEPADDDEGGARGEQKRGSILRRRRRSVGDRVKEALRVVAHGRGDIDRIDSPLHERDRPQVTESRPGFLSVDTGKYTLGPLMALRASALAVHHLSTQRGVGQASTAP